MPTEELEIPVSTSPKSTQEFMDATVVAFRDPSNVPKPFDIVYIDQGEMSGVMVGDVFEIYRGKRNMGDPETGKKLDISDLIVGELQILRPKGVTSSAYITATNGHLDIRVGETLRLVKRIPG